MKQASRFDGLSFDLFSLFQNGLAPSEVYVGGCEILQALVVSSVVVVIDKCVDLLSEITRQVVVFQQDAVLQGLMPPLDLALGLGMVWRAADMGDLPVIQPFGKLARDVAGAVVRQQTRLVSDLSLIHI